MNPSEEETDQLVLRTQLSVFVGTSDPVCGHIIADRISNIFPDQCSDSQLLYILATIVPTYLPNKKIHLGADFTNNQIHIRETDATVTNFLRLVTRITSLNNQKFIFF